MAEFEKGVFCHQCHQKTTRRVFVCHNVMGTKECTLKICDRCLKSRYDGRVDGTVVTEEEASAADWKCLRCTNRCNCGQCRTRLGEKPHGRVVRGSGNPSVQAAAKGKRKAEGSKEPRRVKAEAKAAGSELPLPVGVPLTTVAGIELDPKDVGHALQFIQFCMAFEEVIFLKLQCNKEQAEALLRDLALQQYSSIFEFQAKLLSVQELEIKQEIRPLNQVNEHSWFDYLRCYFSESQLLPEDLPSDFFNRGVEGYHSLDFSQQIKVLNFLCDEALDTNKLSRFIEGQADSFSSRKREANKKVSAAKAKEASLKEQLKTEAAKATTDENAASSSDRKAIVLRLKSEVAQAHAELLEETSLKSKLTRHDAVRSEPDMFDEDGRVFRRLTGYNDGNDMLLQDMGSWDPSISSEEKWFVYKQEQNEAVAKYCSSVRRRNIVTESMLSQTLPSGSGNKEDEELFNETSRSNQRRRHIQK